MIRSLISIAIFSCPMVATAGLDVTAYENLVSVSSATLDANGLPTGRNEVKFIPVEFLQRFEGLVSGQVYRYESSFEFRAGSYSGYNDWRNELAKLAGYSPTHGKATDGGQSELRYDITVWN
jgi:hypothetical protein